MENRIQAAIEKANRPLSAIGIVRALNGEEEAKDQKVTRKEVNKTLYNHSALFVRANPPGDNPPLWTVNMVENEALPRATIVVGSKRLTLTVHTKDDPEEDMVKAVLELCRSIGETKITCDNQAQAGVKAQELASDYGLEAAALS